MIATRRLFAALAVSLLASTALAQAQDADPAPLRMVTSFAIENLDPNSEGYWMHEFGVAELLLRFRDDGEHHPWLLESAEAVDDLTWVLIVRDGVTFHNGKALTGQAVLDAIEHQLANSSSARGTVPQDARFELTGDMEITVTTDNPWPALPGALSSESVFLIYDVEAVEAADGDFESLAGAGIYTGPYVIESLTSEAMVATRNEDYWQGRPALPGIELSFVTDPNARILAVQNNEADIALYPPVAAKPVVDAAPGIHFNSGTPGTGGFMGFMDTRDGPFADPLVQRAFITAIDYDHLANTVFSGLIAEATSLYNPSFPWAVENYRTDLDEAAALLDEAGWTMGSGGLRQKDGQTLDITALIYPQQPDLVPLSTDLQAQMRPLGINVSVQQVDDIYAGLSEGVVDWDLGITSEGTSSWGVVEPFLRRYVAAGGDRAYGGYDNAEVNAAVAELIVTVDADRRNELLARIQTILVEEDPYVFAFNVHQGRVVVNDLYCGYQPGFALLHITWETAPSECQQ